MSLASEFRTLEKMISTKRNELNTLQDKKKMLAARIHKEMVERDITTYLGIDISEVYTAPKSKGTRMTKKEKEEYAISKLRQMGIPNPRAAYQEMQP